MDIDTLNRVEELSPEAKAVVRWGVRLEGALHVIAEHPDVHGDDVSKIKRIAMDAIFADDDK